MSKYLANIMAKKELSELLSFVYDAGFINGAKGPNKFAEKRMTSAVKEISKRCKVNPEDDNQFWKKLYNI